MSDHASYSVPVRTGGETAPQTPQQREAQSAQLRQSGKVIFDSATGGEVLCLLDNETGMHSCLESKTKVAGWHRRQEEASPCPREYRHRSGRARSLMSC
jgi:hypothetical protein